MVKDVENMLFSQNLYMRYYWFSNLVNHYISTQYHVFTQLYYFKTLYFHQRDKLNNMNSEDIEILRHFLRLSNKNTDKDVVQTLYILDKYSNGTNVQFTKNDMSYSYTVHYSGCKFSKDNDFIITDLKSVNNIFYSDFAKNNCQRLTLSNDVKIYSDNKLENGKIDIIDIDLSMNKIPSILHICILDYIDEMDKVLLLQIIFHIFRSFMLVLLKFHLRDMNIYVGSFTDKRPGFPYRFQSLVHDNIETVLHDVDNIISKLMYKPGFTTYYQKLKNENASSDEIRMYFFEYFNEYIQKIINS